jgi:DNA-binding CsgD family transcriptional regulator/tetratricopeptide (TPR) repeat protein
MELIERAGFLSSLRTRLEEVEEGEGHCIMVTGEAGIGKTSLIRAFCKEGGPRVYQGSCDALFTPRPLAPLYDIVWQIRDDIWGDSSNIADRTALFTRVFHALDSLKGKSLVVFEDIHWADEATLDFIKFLARRINRLHCLFILTYRDDEIHSHHPLRSVLGQLPPDSFTRMQLTPLSREAVDKMASEKGYKGEDVYSISGGNPFYVNEILASYSPGVPDNIKDSILSVYHRLEDRVRQVWQILAILPTGLEVRYMEKMNPDYIEAIENCLDLKLLLLKNGVILFKHELYRRTIESSLSPLLRVALNKKILDLFLESFERNQEIERIIHHAKNCNEYDLVVQYAPQAARQAAAVGAHREAAKLYYSAIEYYQGNDRDVLLQLYEPYAYECYLTNKISEAIIYQGRALKIWKEHGDQERIGDCLRFLSRLWWFNGNGRQADSYAEQAIEVLDSQPPSRTKARTFSYLSQLRMLSGQVEECIAWGEKAISLATALGDEEILAHALNNVGAVKMRDISTCQEGVRQLQDSLNISLRNSYHEHAARAYTNQGSYSIETRDYAFARQVLEAGIQYCEERDLSLWMIYMQFSTARLNLETGHWNDACRMTDNLLKSEDHPSIVKIGALYIAATIKMRKGESNVMPLLKDARNRAFDTMELQRIIPVMVAMLEYEWITGNILAEEDDIDATKSLLQRIDDPYGGNEFSYWLTKTGREGVVLKDIHEVYRQQNPSEAVRAARLWEELGSPYRQALALFEGGGEDKIAAMTIMRKLGATAVCEKMKREMRNCGIKSIPRGIRKSTQANPALLTEREVGVLQLLKEGMQNKEIAARLFISAKTVDHHISSILFKLDANSRMKAVQEATQMGII